MSNKLPQEIETTIAELQRRADASDFGGDASAMESAIVVIQKLHTESNNWQAVARNIATSHPEGAEVFRRIALAHGFTV